MPSYSRSSCLKWYCSRPLALGKHLRELEIGALFSQRTGDDDIEIGINTEEIWTDEKAGLCGNPILEIRKSVSARILSGNRTKAER